MTVHKWSIVEASSARQNYGLNMTRQIKPLSERVSKPRKEKPRKRCPFQYCRKIVKRMENHLPQYHKLKGVMLKHYLSIAEEVSGDEEKNREGKKEEPRGGCMKISYFEEDEKEDFVDEKEKKEDILNDGMSRLVNNHYSSYN